jgi:hypothetical protein
MTWRPGASCTRLPHLLSIPLSGDPANSFCFNGPFADNASSLLTAQGFSAPDILMQEREIDVRQPAVDVAGLFRGERNRAMTV